MRPIRLPMYLYGSLFFLWPTPSRSSILIFIWAFSRLFFLATRPLGPMTAEVSNDFRRKAPRPKRPSASSWKRFSSHRAGWHREVPLARRLLAGQWLLGQSPCFTLWTSNEFVALLELLESHYLVLQSPFEASYSPPRGLPRWDGGCQLALGQFNRCSPWDRRRCCDSKGYFANIWARTTATRARRACEYPIGTTWSCLRGLRILIWRHRQCNLYHKSWVNFQ